MTHPCFNCRLPDCDDTSPQCELRRASNLMSRMSKKGWAHLLTQADREAYNAYFQMWKLNRDAQLSESAT